MKCINVVLGMWSPCMFVYLSASLHSAIPTSANFWEYFDANKFQHAGVVAWYMYMKLIMGFSWYMYNNYTKSLLNLMICRELPELVFLNSLYIIIGMCSYMTNIHAQLVVK